MTQPGNRKLMLAALAAAWVIAAAPAAAQTNSVPITTPGHPSSGPMVLSPVPLAPLTELPVGTYQGETNNNTHIVFQWLHGGLTTRPPAATNEFVVCLYPSTSTSGCVWPGIHRGIPTSFTRTQIVSPISGVPIVAKYRYLYTPPFIADAMLDRPLLWTVSACQTSNNCTAGTPREVYFSTKNLRYYDLWLDSLPRGIAPIKNGRVMRGHFEFQYVGATNSGDFAATLQVYEALNKTTSYGWTCETNLTLADPSFASVVLRDGRRVLPAQVTPADSVFAILKPAGDASPLHTFTVPSMASGDTASIEGTAMGANFPTHSFTWRPGETFRTYVVVGNTDTAGSIREHIESDNAKVECQRVIL